MKEISKTPTLESLIRILPFWAGVLVFRPKVDKCLPLLMGSVEELDKKLQAGNVEEPDEKFKSTKISGQSRVEYLKPIDTSYEETKNLLFEIWVE